MKDPKLLINITQLSTGSVHHLVNSRLFKNPVKWYRGVVLNVRVGELSPAVMRGLTFRYGAFPLGYLL
jgi:hypothetical protein